MASHELRELGRGLTPQLIEREISIKRKSVSYPTERARPHSSILPTQCGFPCWVSCTTLFSLQFSMTPVLFRHMANDLSFHHVDDKFGYVGRMGGNPLIGFSDECEPNSPRDCS